MKKYDVIVIGSGCGMNVVDEAAQHGLKVALVDKGPLGGACPNLGCIPSKMLILPADRIVEIQEARKLGIEASVTGIDFNFIMGRMRDFVQRNQKEMRQGIATLRNVDFYEGLGHFVSDYTIEVNGQKITGQMVFIASGSRPLIAPIKGLDSVPYLTSETVLDIKERPDSIIIAGGGYIALEYAHFFAAMGTTVTVIEMADRIALSEEPEISTLLQDEMSKRMEVCTGAQVEEIRQEGDGVAVATTSVKRGTRQQFKSQQVMIATGRRSNADLLKPEMTGVELDNRGYIKVNEYLETTKKNIFAVGDANGRQMFTHVANEEASLVGQNAFHGKNIKMDYSAIPHGIFCHPQVASVGMTEAEARKKHRVMVGRAKYFDVAAGEAMMEERGFAKAIAEQDTMNILGFHIIGPHAATVIQEVIDAMASKRGIDLVTDGIHIHPALPELVLRTLSNLHPA